MTAKYALGFGTLNWVSNLFLLYGWLKMSSDSSESDAALCNLIESIPCGILRLIAYEPVVEEVVRPWLGLLSLECNLTESMDRSRRRG